MILLDTNVVSEVMRPHPESAVIEWVNRADGGSLYVSSITIAEIEYGLHAMPESQRREDLRARFETFIHKAFAQRVLDFDEASARYYGLIMASRRRSGRPLSAPDGQIAAIARRNGMAVATRNESDFSGSGLKIINPWRLDGLL
ncbi:type II toxin-antitoxin system VapC family toxin [Halorhodospira halochloris]|uniref:Ribonuclease VapC n=1 Tax=Halorhodospira halochloris TaxID=1052 RepID=A0A120MZH2_HALHR|nr:type II toxin-antitoxin system VapC family toxin [Halorhodospira halochloris]MBK1652885.1 VapC toxin family PIN domain ribonuclease [Halorhodospira halochloris]MCG5531321.1 type II toxin-antitoxin system VapC family toxin [Halorhodospira halochloris]BAU57013.1 VapC toxin protein [Halorhodospira halochloris]